MPKENESTYNAYPAHREYVNGDPGEPQTNPVTGKSTSIDTRKKNYKLPKGTLTLNGDPFPTDDQGRPFVYIGDGLGAKEVK